ncbi:MAG: SGNH/GDSL hydrolase family protein [Ferruginibacter sp.]
MKKIFLSVLNRIYLKIIGRDDQLKKDWANLDKYSMDNKKLSVPAMDEQRVVFMGDSITEYWKVMDGNFFAAKNYINRGISGQTTPQMLVRFRPDVIELKPAVVVILAGVNDIAENTGPITLEAIFGNIVSMAQLAKENGIVVVLSSVLPVNYFTRRPDLKPAEKVIELNTMIKGHCEKNKIEYIDYHSAMVDENKGLDKKYTDDGLHPTIAGYKIMGPLAERAVKKTLDRL